MSSQLTKKYVETRGVEKRIFFCVDRILSACSSSHYLFAFSLSLFFGVYAAAVREEDDEKSSKSERRMMSSLCLLSEAST